MTSDNEYFEISLKDLSFHAFHGVDSQENKVGNEFRVSIGLRIPVSKSPWNDELENTISYAIIYDIVREQMMETRKLLETVAIAIRESLREKFNMISGGYISITKLTPPLPSITGSSQVSLHF